MAAIRFALALLLTLAAQLLAASPAQAKWLRADTRHFVIYSSGSEKEQQRFGLQLERFNQLLRQRVDTQDDDNPNKLTVYFLGSQEAVSHLYGGKTRYVAGFYSPQEDGTYAVANRSKKDGMFDLDGMTVLFHEYAHHFMFRHFTYAYPTWYVEGFAEFLSTVTFADDGTYTVGKPAYHRALGLNLLAKTPIEKLLFGDIAGMSPEQVDAFYGRSWLLVHMLSMQPEYKGKTKAYFAAIARGKSQREAATEALGDLKLLDKALDSYFNQPKLTYLSSKIPIQVDAAMKVTEIDDVAGQLVMFRLKRKQGKADAKSRDALQKLAAANPARADLWYELALTERDIAEGAEPPERDKAELLAEAAVDRALTAEPEHVRANVLKADILFKRLEASAAATSADWSKARKYLIVDNANAVDDPLVLIEWYRSFAYQRREPTKTAHDALARAFSLAPEVTGLRVQYALDLAATGEFDKAINLVEFLAQDPHEGEQGRKLLQILFAMRDAAKGKSTTPVK